jgi:hypothetical protein
MADDQISSDHVEVLCFRKSPWGCGIIGVLAAAACVWTDSCTLLIEAFLYLVVFQLMPLRTMKLPFAGFSQRKIYQATMFRPISRIQTRADNRA